MKWNKITNGLLLDNQSISNKYNINLSYYPGINLPSFNLSFGKDLRESGEISEGYSSGFTWAEPVQFGEEPSCQNLEHRPVGGQGSRLPPTSTDSWC